MRKYLYRQKNLMKISTSVLMVCEMTQNFFSVLYSMMFFLYLIHRSVTWKEKNEETKIINPLL